MITELRTQVSQAGLFVSVLGVLRQLGFGQAGLAGGMHYVCDATRQIMGRAGAAQVGDCNRAFVSGNGGILSEQTTLILQGD